MSNEYTKTFTAADVTPETLKDKGLVLVDFWATWCGPCRMVGPIVDQLAQEYDGKITIGKLDIDQHGAAAMGYGITGVPTLLLFKDGEIAERIVGARNKPALDELLRKYI